jgi:hypothetical protein
MEIEFKSAMSRRGIHWLSLIALGLEPIPGAEAIGERKGGNKNRCLQKRTSVGAWEAG